MSLKSWKDVTASEFGEFLRGLPGPLAPRDSAYLLFLLLGRLTTAEGFGETEPTWVFSPHRFGDALDRLTPTRRKAAEACAARIVGWHASADLPPTWNHEGEVAVAFLGAGFDPARLADELTTLPPTPAAAWMLADLVTTVAAHSGGLSLGRAIDRAFRGLDEGAASKATVALDRVYRTPSTLAVLEAGALGADDRVAEAASDAHAWVERYVGGPS